LHAQLALIDPITAGRLAPHDAQRIQRALEVYHASGQPLSFFHQKQARAHINSAGIAIDSIANMPILSLEPSQRAWLHGRIEQRFEQMLQAGLMEEVMRLKERGDLNLNLPSMRCVGYRQTWEMLDGAFAASHLPEKGWAATRQLAKRQITWQRSMQPPAFNKHVLPVDHPDANAQALAWFAHWLDGAAAPAIEGN